MDNDYTDSGFSGGNIERPALQQLLTDIEKGLINAVCVYRLNRYSPAFRPRSDSKLRLTAHESNGPPRHSLDTEGGSTVPPARILPHPILTQSPRRAVYHTAPQRRVRINADVCG